jgi:hypothetical protein
VDTLRKERANRGWVPALSLSSSFSFAHNKNVVGSQEGQTWNVGPGVDARLAYFSDPHEWRNTLVIRHVQTRTPIIDEFVKTVDNFQLESIYLFHIPAINWLGPYVRGTLETALFPTEDVRTQTSNYTITELDGSKNQVSAKRLALNDSFAPTTLKQATGIFAKPVDKQAVVLEFRGGIGAREVITGGGLVVKDAPDNSTINLDRLQDYQQVGGELYAGVGGTLLFEKWGQKSPIKYRFSVEAMMPVYASRDENQSALELTNIFINASVSFQLFSWASLDYHFKAVREPLTLDEFQIQNNLMLNFSYFLLGAPPKKPPTAPKS